MPGRNILPLAALRMGVSNLHAATARPETAQPRRWYLVGAATVNHTEECGCVLFVWGCCSGCHLPIVSHQLTLNRRWHIHCRSLCRGIRVDSRIVGTLNHAQVQKSECTHDTYDTHDMTRADFSICATAGTRRGEVEVARNKARCDGAIVVPWPWRLVISRLAMQCNRHQMTRSSGLTLAFDHRWN